MRHGQALAIQIFTILCEWMCLEFHQVFAIYLDGLSNSSYAHMQLLWMRRWEEEVVIDFLLGKTVLQRCVHLHQNRIEHQRMASICDEMRWRNIVLSTFLDSFNSMRWMRVSIYNLFHKIMKLKRKNFKYRILMLNLNRSHIRCRVVSIMIAFTCVGTLAGHINGSGARLLNTHFMYKNNLKKIEKCFAENFKCAAQ